MSADETRREGFSLKRWSERKLRAARTATPTPTLASARDGVAARTLPAEELLPPSVAPATGPRPATLAESDAPAVPEPTALPPVESLTVDSDFTPFLQPQVGERLRRQALRQLFRDPHFNAMDGLDVYIDDYSRPDPLPAELARKLVQARYILDPPATRVNADGVVEDVPPEANAPDEPVASAGDEPASASAPTSAAEVAGDVSSNDEPGNSQRGNTASA